MKISTSTIVYTLVCLVGIVLSPIAAAEPDSFDRSQRQRGLKSDKSDKGKKSEKWAPPLDKWGNKSEKSSKLEKWQKSYKSDKKVGILPPPTFPTAAPTAAPTRKKGLKKGDKKKDKKGKSDKKAKKTEAPTTAPFSNSIEVVVPICSECFGGVASAAAASPGLISEMQISAASAFPFSIDPNLIAVDVLESQDCTVVCGNSIGGRRNLQLTTTTVSSFILFRLDFTQILPNNQSLSSVNLTVDFQAAFTSNESLINSAFTLSVGVDISFNFQSSSVSFVEYGGTKAPGATTNRYLGYLY